VATLHWRHTYVVAWARAFLVIFQKSQFVLSVTSLPGTTLPLVRLTKHGRKQSCAAIMYQPKNFSDIAEPFSELSHREQQVVTLVCEGLSNKEIATGLGVTEGTIKIHLHSIFRRLGVRSRIELMIALAGRK
jgi:DNA-binding NarL/FixJ family response regulator